MMIDLPEAARSILYLLIRSYSSTVYIHSGQRFDRFWTAFSLPHFQIVCHLLACAERLLGLEFCRDVHHPSFHFRVWRRGWPPFDRFNSSALRLFRAYVNKCFSPPCFGALLVSKLRPTTLGHKRKRLISCSTVGTCIHNINLHESPKDEQYISI